MQGDKSIISLLNQVLTLELTSINQYFLHARMFRNWGFETLNKVNYKKSIKDMKQADDLIERILFLEGLPNLQHIEKVRIGEDPLEMLLCDYDLQKQQLLLLNSAIKACEAVKDYVSREILCDILGYEEGHLDWLETQQTLIESMGKENYLQSQMG